MIYSRYVLWYLFFFDNIIKIAYHISVFQNLNAICNFPLPWHCKMRKLKCFKDCFWIFYCKIIVSDINVAAIQLLYVNIWMHSNKENSHMNMFSWKELHFVYHVRYIILYAHMCLHFSFPHDFCACSFPHKVVLKLSSFPLESC